MMHRDDLPMEAVEGIIAKIKEHDPQAKVMFAGDLPTDHPEYEQVKKWGDTLKVYLEQTFVGGQCHLCRAQIEPWPPEDFAGWTLPDGWQFWTPIGDTPPVFCCPNCKRKEDDDDGEDQV